MAGDEGDGLEHVFDVAMAPVLALDGGDGGDILGCQQCYRW